MYEKIIYHDKYISSNKNEILLYSHKKYAIEELVQLNENSCIIENYEFAKLSPSNLTDLFSTKGDIISLDKPQLIMSIGNDELSYNFKNSFYKRLTYKMLTMTTFRFSIDAFKLSWRDIAKVIMSGRMLKELKFRYWKIKLWSFPKSFISYDIDSNANLNLIHFGGWKPDGGRLGNDESFMVTTIMRDILGSYLVDKLDAVYFYNLPKTLKTDEIISELSYDKVVVEGKFFYKSMQFVLSE